MALSHADLALERDSDVPLGTQLAWKLRAAVAAGKLRRGDRLPGVRELAGIVGVNVNTVRSVYARLGEQGVIESEHGRGTFVSSRAGSAELGGLVERAAREARRHAVDPRDLAAMLYARFDAPGAGFESDEAESGARRGLRAEIEALEQDLAVLEPGFVEHDAGGARAGTGARLVSARELEVTRDELSARVTARRRELRAARQKSRSVPRAPQPDRSSSPWPELLAALPARPAT